VNQLKQDLVVEIAERISTKENDRSNEIHALKKELDLLREGNHIVKEQLATNSTTANDAITGLRCEIEKLQKQQIESTEQQIKSTEQQEKDNKLSLEVEELHKKIVLLEQENQELKGQIKQEIAQLQQINQSNQNADLENLRSEVTQLKQEKSIAQEENARIAKELNDKIESLRQNHQSTHETTQHLQLDLESLVKTEIANVEEKINKIASNTDFETETSVLKQQNESVKNQIESLTSDIALLKEANTSLNNSLESVKLELVTSKTDVADLTNAMKADQRNNEEIIGKMKVLETNVQLLQEELKQHQQNVGQASPANLNFEDAQQQINDLKSSVEVIKEQLKHESDRTSLTELQTTISNLAEKQKTNDELMNNLLTKVSDDRQVIEEFKLVTEKQLQRLHYKDMIDTLSQRVSTVQESVDKFEADFKPNVLAIIDAHQALTSVSDTCQKLSSKYHQLDDAVQHVSKSVDANNVTFDNFTKQLKTIEINKLPATKFTEFVDNDWNSHIKSFNELQGLVKSLCETVKNPVAFSSDSPHDHTHEIKYEEEFNVTAKKSTTLVQSIRTNNNNGHQNQHNRAGQMDRMNKVFAKFLAGTGVGIAAGLMSQLILMDRATSVQE
jgi:chromosome segregation ATPase